MLWGCPHQVFSPLHPDFNVSLGPGVIAAAGETATFAGTPSPSLLERLLQGEGVQRNDMTLAGGGAAGGVGGPAADAVSRGLQLQSLWRTPAAAVS